MEGEFLLIRIFKFSSLKFWHFDDYLVGAFDVSPTYSDHIECVRVVENFCLCTQIQSEFVYLKQKKEACEIYRPAGPFNTVWKEG